MCSLPDQGKEREVPPRHLHFVGDKKTFKHLQLNFQRAYKTTRLTELSDGIVSPPTNMIRPVCKLKNKKGLGCKY